MASLTDIYAALQNAVVALNALSSQVSAIALSAGPIGPTGGSGGGTQLTGIATYTTTNHTVLSSEAGFTIQMNVASANTLTIAQNSSVNLPILSYINFTQLGAGQTTITAGSGVTILNRNGLKGAGQYAMATIYHSTTLNTWIAGGDLTT